MTIKIIKPPTKGPIIARLSISPFRKLDPIFVMMMLIATMKSLDDSDYEKRSFESPYVSFDFDSFNGIPSNIYTNQSQEDVIELLKNIVDSIIAENVFLYDNSLLIIRSPS